MTVRGSAVTGGAWATRGRSPAPADDVSPLSADPDFALLFRAHERSVRQTCRYLLGSADEAEDAVQEIFLRVQQRYRQFDRTRPFDRWVSGVASHYCLDILRRRRREAGLFGAEGIESASVPSNSASPLDALLARERGRDLRQAVAALPAKYRVPMVLTYFNEMSYAEVGRLLDLDRGHVAVLVFRGRRQLRRMLTASRTCQ